MNANCCHDTSNLNNPSPRIVAHVGPYPPTNSSHKECFYYDTLPPAAKALRLAATERRTTQGRNITDSYTFEEKPPPIDATMDDQQPPPPPTHTTDSHPTHITTIHRPIDC